MSMRSLFLLLGVSLLFAAGVPAGSHLLGVLSQDFPRAQPAGCGGISGRVELTIEPCSPSPIPDASPRKDDSARNISGDSSRSSDGTPSGTSGERHHSGLAFGSWNSSTVGLLTFTCSPLTITQKSGSLVLGGISSAPRMSATCVQAPGSRRFGAAELESFLTR